MNMAFLIYRYFPYGGQQRNMLAIATEALLRRHQVTVICHQWQGVKPAGLKVIEVPVWGLGNHTKLRVFSDNAQVLLEDKKTDLVVGFIKLPGLDVYYAADPCFAEKAYNQRGWFYRLSPRTKRYLVFEDRVFSAGSRTHILEVSTKERSSYVRHYGTAEQRFHTLIPGISKDRLAPENYSESGLNKRQELGLQADDIVLMCLGSGFKTKGLDRSILTLRELHGRGVKARLLVVGQDNAQPFQKLAAHNGLKDYVYFLGGRDDVSGLLQASNLLLHPAYRENTGNTLLEAMIAGLPVIATETCGYAHYIENSAMGAVVSDQAAPEEIADKVNELLTTSVEEWHRRGKAFASAANIYDRPSQVVDILESVTEID